MDGQRRSSRLLPGLSSLRWMVCRSATRFTSRAIWLSRSRTPSGSIPTQAAPIVAPFAGTVVTAVDGVPERNPVHLARDLAVALKNAVRFNPNASSAALHAVLGNHIILRKGNEEIYAFLAHARQGSIQVTVGQPVLIGQQLAQVGHSGNSTAPHLHFQLMDGADILTAQGLPCCFEAYESWREGAWVRVRNGMPGKRAFVRYAA
ncbi:MAG: M23 family metallopeptidase [Betaproteobacteria bacterium]|nr:M23 family metallopeptidase [Betaproteobacteria bacterium]